MSVSPRRRRLVVADDSIDGADAMAELLEILGHEVHTAHDGLEAVEVVGRVRPELVLMDIEMPRLDGLEATRRIRALPGGEAIVIIALSGWSQESDRTRSQEAGCNGHLVKPIDMDQLEKLLHQLSSEPATTSDI